MVDRLRPVRVSTVRIRNIFSGSGMTRPQIGGDDVRMCAVEVNASSDGGVVVLGVSQRIKGHVSERERGAGMVWKRRKYFSIGYDWRARPRAQPLLQKP